MNTGIIGAGAMGSLFAYYLQKAGFDAVLYEKSKEISAAVQNGLEVDINGKKEIIHVPVSSSASILKDSEYVFVFVKSYATAVAMKDIRNHVRKDAVLISLQNGIGNEETIRDMLPENLLLYGTITAGATKTGPGSVKFGGAGNILIGGGTDEQLNSAIAVLKKAGFSADRTAKPYEAVWRKAVINAAINPLGALLKVPNGQLIKNEQTLLLMRLIISEAVDAAAASGLSLDKDEMEKEVTEICEKTGINECSMLQDVKAGRRTEIESITGEIISCAGKNGLPSGANRSVYLLIKALESTYLAEG